MLPPFLQSSYARYKNYTNSFATWLLDAAKKCGYQPDGSASIGPSVKKGKREAAPKKIKYKTTIKDMRKLAQVVANSALNVPGPVRAIARRAIKARKDVTSWFLGQGGFSSDKKHAHFISVLEEICEMLESKFANPFKRDNSTSWGKEDKVDVEGCLNTFSVLTVGDAQDLPQTPSDSKQTVNVEVIEEVAKDEEDAFFSDLFFKAYCLFHDLHNMRTFLS